MEHREGEFEGERGIRIWFQVWRPETPKAVLVVAHGLGEHSGRYGRLVDALVPRGYALYALDHRGHGRSGGRRGHVDRFDDYVADVGRLIELARAREPGLPVFLYGHSMGGLIALDYALKHPKGLQGVVASSPGLRRAFKVPQSKLVLGRLMSRLWPTFTQRSGLPPEGLSHDPQVVADYRADPLVHDLVSARLFTELTDTGEAVLARARELQLPCLLVQGEADPIVACEGARRCYADLGSADKALHVYEGFFHESHNEVGYARPLADIQAWLDAHVPD